MEMVSWGMGIHSPISYLSASEWLPTMNKSGSWTMEEDKIFEQALAIYDKDTPDRWQKIVDRIPGKSLDEVKRRYRDLEEDVSHIEAGLIPIPGYSSSSFTLEWVDSRSFDGIRHNYGKRSGVRTSDHERKKGVPWTEDEHRLFLMGLKKYGKGDWRNISRNFVTSRTPTQVASHAQKYFIRLSSGGKDKRRSSIHDITTVNLPDDRPPPSPSSSPSVKSETTGAGERFLGALGNTTKDAASAFFHPSMAVPQAQGSGYAVVKRECQQDDRKVQEPPVPAGAREQDVFQRMQSFRSR